MDKKKYLNWHQQATLGVSKKVRNDYADYDYIDQLDKDQLKWLKGFHREYVNADFQHNHKKHYETNESKRDIYRLNNNKNRCLYNMAKWFNVLNTQLEYYEEQKTIDSRWYEW